MQRERKNLIEELLKDLMNSVEQFFGELFIDFPKNIEVCELKLAWEVCIINLGNKQLNQNVSNVKHLHRRRKLM